MPPTSVRLEYGPKKYAALHLMLCRWVRLYGTPEASYCYVTLGGTELRDIESLRFVDTKLTSSVWSYEEILDRYKLAKNNAAALVAATGMTLDLQHASLFSHKRTSDLPHIFFVDILGICAWGDYDQLFAAMFQNEVVREGDCLLITSHLGHRPGPDKVREHFGGEFAVLGIDESDNGLVRSVYRRAHPTMTLFKALCLNGIQSELSLRCFGAVKYRDGAPMGIYGYTVSGGKTELATFVNDGATAYFDIGTGRQCKPEAF
jgi:hypothetical protein